MRQRIRSQRSKRYDSRSRNRIHTAKSPQQRQREDFGFRSAFAELVGPHWMPSIPKRRGRRPRVPLYELLTAVVFHFMNGAGTLAEHFAALFDDALADSSCSDRRTRLPWQVFSELLQRALKPLAIARRHPESFWRRWRLLALDGTQFSL